MLTEILEGELDTSVTQKWYIPYHFRQDVQDCIQCIVYGHDPHFCCAADSFCQIVLPLCSTRAHYIPPVRGLTAIITMAYMNDDDHDGQEEMVTKYQGHYHYLSIVFRCHFAHGSRTH